MSEVTKKLPLRSMYTAPKGKTLCGFDLSAAEAWIVAYLAHDTNMKRELAEGDIHSFSATGIFDIKVDLNTPGKKKYEGLVPEEQRYVGKKMNHAGNYRTGPFKIAEFINKEGIISISIADAKRFHAKWLATFNLQNWWSEIDYIASTSRTMTTVYGFRRRFWGMYGDDLKKEMTAFEPQSTVADHMHGAIHPELGIRGGNLAIYEDIVLPSKGEIVMCNTAHDSVMLEVPTSLVSEVVPHVISLLKRPLVVKGEEFTIPVDAEVGDRWKEMEKWKG
jgi:DNA polymerase I-like protein with 3'-5' exonuclease and polymerase domains